MAKSNWVWDACLELIERERSGDEDANVYDISSWLERHGVNHNEANWVSQCLCDEPLDDLVVDGVARQELLDACSVVWSHNVKKKLPKGAIIVGKKPDGQFTWQPTKLLVDFDLTVLGDEHGEPIWQFDPETLELIEVPKLWQLRNSADQALGRMHLCFARLSDVESGKI